MITNENEIAQIKKQTLQHVNSLSLDETSREMAYQLQTLRTIKGAAYCRIGIETDEGIKEERVEIDKLQAAISEERSLFIPLLCREVGGTESEDLFASDIQYIVPARGAAIFSREYFEENNKRSHILDSARVGEFADLRGMATIKDNAVLEGGAVADRHALIEGNALITGTARVYGHVGGDTVVTAGDFPIDADIRSNQDFAVLDTDSYYRVDDSPVPEAEITIYRNWDNQPQITLGDGQSQSLEEFEAFFRDRSKNCLGYADKLLMETVKSSYERVAGSCARQQKMRNGRERKTSFSDIKGFVSHRKTDLESKNNRRGR